MLRKLKGVARRLVGNRRQRPRKHFVYDTVLRDEKTHVVFRGKTTDLSRSGARLTGFPDAKGLVLDQAVHVEFLLLPKDVTKVAKRPSVNARVWRVEEFEDRYIVAIRFDRELEN